MRIAGLWFFDGLLYAANNLNKARELFAEAVRREK
jgi:hypothetical protein